MGKPPVAEPGARAQAGQLGRRRADSTRVLSADVRWLLDRFREAAAARGSAVLVADEKSGLLRVRWRVPSVRQAAVLHPIAGDCLIARALEQQKPTQATARPGHRSPACASCVDLFGSEIVFAAPLSIGEPHRAVVAAFAGPTDRGRHSTADAMRVARHLGACLRSFAVNQGAERRASQLAAVNEVAANLTSVIDADLLFPRIVADIVGVVRCDVANLYLFDPEERRLRIVASHGASPERQRLLEETAWNRMTGSVFRSQQCVVVHDIAQHERELGALGQPTYISRVKAKVRASAAARAMSAIWAPIVFRGQSLGVIGLTSSSPGAFDDEDRSLVLSLANHAAIAIANAQIYREVDVRLQGKVRDLTTLSKIGQAIGASLQTDTVLQSIVQGTAEAFQSSGSSLMLLNDASTAFVIAADHGLGPSRAGQDVPVDGTASGWVVEHREPLFVPSVATATFDLLRPWFKREGVESFIAVPLIVQGTAIGSLNVYSRRGQQFGSTDVDLLQGLAAQAAIAIDHASLYESVAREKAKLEAIVESLREGLVLVGPSGNVVYASHRLSDLLGLDPGELVRASVDDIWCRIAQCSAARDEAAEKAKTIESGSSPTAVFTLVQPFRRDLEVQSFDVRYPAADLLGRGYLIRDVTQQAEVERLKDSILSTVSHELRTPLAAIKGFATSLLRTDMEWDQESRRDFIEQIDREADRLGVLVRNLLDMSRLDAGTLRLDREWCEVPDLMAEVVARMAPLAADHRLILDPAGAKLFAFIDRRYLERVVWNLVDNALKYSPRGSTVALRCATDGERITISVADQGVGIAPEERERVFERFYRSAGSRSASGLGLGLAICRGIVEAHGGSITVESEPGHGSIFSVRLPAGPRRAPRGRSQLRPPTRGGAGELACDA